MINIFDASGFLYAQRKGTTVHGLNLTGLELLLYRLEGSAGHCFVVLDKANKNRFNVSHLTNESGYKANRDGKPLEIGIMESFLETFLANEPGITIIRSEGDFESDDNMYTIAKDFGYFRRQEVIVHADDIDACACLFDKNVEIHPITSHAPKRTIAEYQQLVDRGSYVPLYCVAHHIIENGKKSDNIPPSNILTGHTRRVDVLLSKWKRSGNLELASKVKIASEYDIAVDIISEIYLDATDLTGEEADAKYVEAMERAEYVCCRYNHDLQAGKTNIMTPKRGVPFYTAYAAIGSSRRPSNNYGLIDDTLLLEMENFLQQRGLSEDEIVQEYGIRGCSDISNVDLSNFDFFDDSDEDEIEMDDTSVTLEGSHVFG